MERSWARSSVVCLRLIHNQTIYNHCSLCTFLQEGNIDHRPHTPAAHAEKKPIVCRTTTPCSDISDCSYYTARTTTTDNSSSSSDHHDDDDDDDDDDDRSAGFSWSSRRGSSDTLRAPSGTQHDRPTPTPSTPTRQHPPRLRRSNSPTQCSLRELNSRHASHARTTRQQQSEERLQRVYESQIMAYLNDDGGAPGLVVGVVR